MALSATASMPDAGSFAKARRPAVTTADLQAHRLTSRRSATPKLSLSGSSSKSSGLHRVVRSPRLDNGPLAAPVLQAFSASGSLRGVMIFDETWDEFEPQKGIYSLSFSSPEGIAMIAPLSSADVGLFYHDNVIYAPVLEKMFGQFVVGSGFHCIDATTGATLASYSWPDRYAPVASTYVVSRATGLSCVYDNLDKYYMLATVSVTGEINEVRNLGEFGFTGGLACTPGGKVYALDAAGALYTIDPDSYQYTKIGDTGVKTTYATSLYYDAATARLYTSTTPDMGPGAFYSIDPATCAATKLYDFATRNEFGLFYTLPEAPDDAAPAAPSQLTAAFPDGALMGTVTFLPPALTVSGSTGYGPIEYTVEANGLQVASGSTIFGAPAVSVPVTLDRAGNYDITVTCSSSGRRGHGASTRTFVGTDLLDAVTGLTLKYADGKFALAWEAAKAHNGGYFDPAEVSYMVTRHTPSSERVVAQNLAATTFTDPYAEPAEGVESVWYTVTVRYAGVSGGPSAISERVVTGSLRTPYAENFASADAVYDYTIINANGDNRVWEYDYNDDWGGTMYLKFNEDKKADDYLVLPGLRLEKGKMYFFSFMAGASNDANVERVAAYVGKRPEADALTTELVPPTAINTPLASSDGRLTGRTFTSSFTPDEDGVYYFAIRGMSDPDRWALLVTNISVTDGMSALAPAAVTGLSLTADDNGESRVTIRFNAPSVTLSGTKLEEITSIDVMRGDDLVESVDVPTPGAPVEVVDENAGEGSVTYTVVPVNSHGEGMPASASVIVGVQVPAAPGYLNYAYGRDHGELVFEWPEVTVDINGVESSDNTYTLAILDGEQWVPVVEEILETTCTYRYCSASAEQEFVQFAVFAANSAGTGDGVASSLIPVGAPYEMPYHEGGDISTLLGIETLAGEAGFDVYADGSVQGVNSPDGDGAYFVFVPQNINDSSRLFTGLIYVDENAGHPVFSYEYFCLAPDDLNTIQPCVIADGEVVNLGEPLVCGSGTPASWRRVNVPLDDFKGRYVQVGLTVTGVNYSITVIDDLTVANRYDNDLKVSLSAPKTVAAGSDLHATALVTNLGSLPSQGCSVTLIMNHEKVAVRGGRPLAPGESCEVALDCTVGLAAPETLELKAYVYSQADDYTDNDASRTLKTQVKYPDLPAASSLEGAVGSEGVTLTWGAPVYEQGSTAVTDSFEGCGSFAGIGGGELCGWKFIDLDGSPSGAIQGMGIPGITVGEPATFFIFDYAEKPNGAFAPHSGDKFMGCLYNADGSVNDDWAISPRLNGSAQTVTFMARAFLPGYAEVLQVLYSTTDDDPDNFMEIETFSNVRTDNDYAWEEYSFDLPEGARYFAIHYCAKDAFMVMIDDVTYAAEGTLPLQLLGYNVYRDGMKLNDKPLTDTSFTDAEKPAGAGYTVTAVYNRGESRPLAVIYPNGPSSVEGIDGGVTVRGLAGAIEVKGVAGTVSVADMQGRVIYRGAAGRIPALLGAYVVTAPSLTRKVIVR